MNSIQREYSKELNLMFESRSTSGPGHSQDFLKITTLRYEYRNIAKRLFFCMEKQKII